MDDKEEFNMVAKAFDDLGFTKKEVHGLFSLIAAILHCGNIDFSPDGEGSKVSNRIIINYALLVSSHTNYCSHVT